MSLNDSLFSDAIWNEVQKKRYIDSVDGDNVILECNVCSNPPANFTWYRHGTVISYDKEYKLNNVSKEDTGYYTCIASTTIDGQIHDHSFNIVLSVNVVSPLSKTNIIVIGSVLTVAFLGFTLLVVLVRKIIARTSKQGMLKYH